MGLQEYHIFNLKEWIDKIARMSFVGPKLPNIELLSESQSTMTFTIDLLRSARKELNKLDKKNAENIFDHLAQIKADPFRPRPGMNIDKVEGNRKPPAYRLRIGRLRIEYLVIEDEGKIVVFRIFMKKRSSDYR